MSHDDELELVAEDLYRSGTVAIQKYNVLGSPNDQVWLHFRPDGRLFKRWRLRHGEQYCDTGPALEQWHHDGTRERVQFTPITTHALGPDAPDLQEFHTNGMLAGEETRLYDTHGMLVGKKRKDWYDNGQLHIKGYYAFDNSIDPGQPFPKDATLCLSRKGDKPASREWFRSGRLKTKKYALLGQLHRENGGDMVICYHANGRKKYTMWHVCSRVVEFEYDTKERVRCVQCRFYRDGWKHAAHYLLYDSHGSLKQERLALDGKDVEPDKIKGALEELFAAECPHTPTCPTS